MQRLSGKRIIVTGAAQGLGRAFTLYLVEQGARVLALDTQQSPLAALAATSPSITAICADVSSEEFAGEAARRAQTLWGGLDGLVNNAAIVGGLTRAPIDQIPAAEFDRVMQVNVKGAWLMARAVHGVMRDAGGGSIINLSSEVAYSGSRNLSHYVTSKAAIIGLTRALAREFGPERIRVNALAPGYTDTEGARHLADPSSYDVSQTPLGRVGQPTDLLGAMIFLLSDESAFVSGQVLLVNGGRVL